jgi:hypothetical protein
MVAAVGVTDANDATSNSIDRDGDTEDNVGNESSVEHTLPPLPKTLPRFSNIAIPDGILGCGIDDDEKWIPSDRFSTDDYANDSEDQFVLGAVLSIKQAEPASNVMVYKKQKTGESATAKGKPYDRLITFADLAEAGKCFALICPSKEKSKNFFRHVTKYSLGTGHIFYIGEPKCSVSRLGNENAIPVIDGYSGYAFPIKNGAQFCPSAELTLSETIGETKYFCYHNCRLQMKNSNFETAACNGSLCDRQASVKDITKFRCGCFHSDNAMSGKVVTMNLTIPCSASFHVNGHYCVKGFRSLATSKLFVKESSWSKIDIHKKVQRSALREAVKRINEYVSNRGGWTIIGWWRVGNVSDSSDPKDAEKIASINPKPHVTYAMPSDLDLVDSDELKSMMVDLNQLADDRFVLGSPVGVGRSSVLPTQVPTAATTTV